MHQEVSLEGLRGRLVIDQCQFGQGEKYELRVRFNLTSRANIDNGSSNYRDREDYRLCDVALSLETYVERALKLLIHLLS